MATCKDCIHVKVCQKTRIMNPAYDYAPKCNDFKDRSRFVELYFNSNCPAFEILAEIDGYVIATIFESAEVYSSKEEAEQAFYKKMERR